MWTLPRVLQDIKRNESKKVAASPELRPFPRLIAGMQSDLPFPATGVMDHHARINRREERSP
jgi:hypothetical protein